MNHPRALPERLRYLRLALAAIPLLLCLTGCSHGGQASEHGPLAVRDEGSGEVIVLLHGMGDTSQGWQQVEKALLGDGFRVIVWDALGAGDSPKPRHGDYSIHGHARRLEEMLAERGLSQVVLVGHSLGGATALLYAQEHPERVAKLVLINPAAYREGAVKLRWFWNAPLLPEVVLGLAPRSLLVDKGMKLNFHNDSLITDDLRKAYILEAKKPGTIRAFIEQERQLIPPDIEAFENGHRTITAPTLILWGKEDVILPETQAQRLTKEIPFAELVMLPNIGHSPHLEAPDRVSQEIITFASRQKSPHTTASDERLLNPLKQACHDR